MKIRIWYNRSKEASKTWVVEYPDPRPDSPNHTTLAEVSTVRFCGVDGYFAPIDPAQTPQGWAECEGQIVFHNGGAIIC